jgi:hypothetical protein
MQPNVWLPLTEYALRSGMSISTLRRKIKSNSVDYKMEEGRYLIRFDEFGDEPTPTNVGFASSDAPKSVALPAALPVPVPAPPAAPTLLPSAPSSPRALPSNAGLYEELKKIREELAHGRDEGSLRWRALEARVAGLAKKLEQFTEQMAELKMLVKIFEEKLDARL